MSIKELLNTLSRYDSRRKRKKLSEIRLEKTAKIRNISKNELNQAKKLQRKSIVELKGIARFRKIKNREKLTKEELIITLLKSESGAAELLLLNKTVILKNVLIITPMTMILMTIK